MYFSVEVTLAIIFQTVVFIFFCGRFYQQNRQLVIEIGKLRMSLKIVRKRAHWLDRQITDYFYRNGWEFEPYDGDDDDDDTEASAA